MSALQTFRFRLEPDPEIPRFKRLHWELVDVPIADVLTRGVHPWDPDKHPSILDAFVQRMNCEEAKVTDLVPMGHSHDIIADSGYIWIDKSSSKFQRTLKAVQEGIYFVVGLSYVELLGIAKERLRARWSHGVAKTLAEKSHYGFQALRQFLKSKDKSIKLSSYDDIDGYDLGRILSLEDFEQHDKLLVSEGIPTQNFRLASALSQFADNDGRLRLVPEIRALTFAVIMKSDKPHVCGTHVQWHVTRTGKMLTFRPDLGNNSVAKRAAAEAFAMRYRVDDRRFVFRTTVDKLTEMLERNEGAPTFPSLNYTSKQGPPTATAEVEPSRVRAFHIGKYPTSRCSGDILREVLREHGVPMTGAKDKLVSKLAGLIADTYAKHQSDLDHFFAEHRFLRIASAPSSAADLPILEDMRYLRNLVLTAYVIRHLRGNAILEPSHENATYTVEELALALLEGKLAFTGALLRVA
ncbi:MAG: hypothetical protein HUU46_07470 [Candidatus Hydrogenedentes bacterium]|nr:hypothetical protein [Candidatus Hydrogenedentota bacterium]